MTDEISDLRFFLLLAEARSLSEVARRRAASLASTSRRLAAMESRLGVKLVDRTSRHFHLTQEGALLRERGATVIAELDSIQNDINGMVVSPRGHIRIGMPIEIGRRRFAPWVAEFVALNPGMTLELVLTDSLIDVVSDELDLALVLQRPSGGSMVARRLLRSRRVLCASPTYLERSGAPTSPHDLIDHASLCLVRGRSVLNEWRFVDGNERKTLKVRSSLSTTNAEALHDWVLAGQGIAIKALWDVEDDFRSGALAEVLPGLLQSDVDLFVTYPSQAYLPQRVRALIDFLVTKVRQSGLNSAGAPLPQSASKHVRRP